MFHELSNMLEVDTPLGKGVAFLIEGGDHDYFYTCIMKETRAIVTFRQHELQVTRAYTLGWGMTHDDMRKILEKLKNGNRHKSEQS